MWDSNSKVVVTFLDHRLQPIKLVDEAILVHVEVLEERNYLALVDRQLDVDHGSPKVVEVHSDLPIARLPEGMCADVQERLHRGGCLRPQY